MGKARRYHAKALFVIEIDGVECAEFFKCSELEAVINVIKHKEGGRLHAHKSLGTVQFNPITLERGVCGDFDLWNWFKASYDAASGTGATDDAEYRTFDIVQLDRARNELLRWNIKDALCTGYKAGSWDNDADEVVMESITVDPDSWEPVPSS